MEKRLYSSGSSKVKDSWESFRFDKDYPYGYPWPPRYYTCSFCQREFRSAQALGGHMNIHRRDRARLRDLSPSNSPLCSSNNSDQNPNPNPNPNSDNINPSTTIISSPSSSSTNNHHHTHQSYSLVSLSLSSTPPSHHHSVENRTYVSSNYDHFNKKSTTTHGDDDYQEVRVLKKNNNSSKEVVRLDLELCVGEAKEDLDLELRLGI